MRTSPRRRAREFVLQGLYQRQLSGNAGDAIRAQLAEAGGFREGGRGVLRRAVGGRHRRIRCARRCSLLPYLDRRAAELSPIERAILVIGAWELAAPDRDSLPRRDQRGDRAREGVRRNRRAQVRQRRAGQARRDAARGRDGSRRAATPAPTERDASGCAGGWACSGLARVAAVALALPRRRRRARCRSTARTIRMPASSPRRRSRATRASPSRWCASRPAKCSRSFGPSATIRNPTSGTAARSIRSCRARPRACSRRTGRRGCPSCTPGRSGRRARRPTAPSRSTGSCSASARTRRSWQEAARRRRAAGRIS